MSPFVHPQGICESASVGHGTRIWAFAHVLPGATIGEDCNICDHVFVENDVVIGDRVTVKSGVQLWDGLRLEDDVFVGPNATFTNDRFPRSRLRLDQVPKTRICKGASVGANATVLPGVVIGMEAMIGAGSVVTADVPPRAVVMGNPARIARYIDASVHTGKDIAEALPPGQNVTEMAVRGVRVHRLRVISDPRGSLSVAEYGDDLPFSPKRYFIVYDVPSKGIRGAHVHRECQQFLVCVKGSVAVLVDDGLRREEILLDRPNLGVYVPPLVWAVQYKHSADAVLLVLASHAYDPADYIRDYVEYLGIVSDHGTNGSP